VYAREIEGKEFSFGVSGKLIRNVMVMYDRQTESLWSQLLGESVSGEMQGTRLEYLPSWHTTWRQWKELHPDTLALKKGFIGRGDPYASYYRSGSAGVIGETFSDDRLSTKEFVIGVALENQAIAYPFRNLNDQPVVNDTVDGRDLLVVFEAKNGVGLVYDRFVGDRLLTFELTERELFTLKDNQTGTTWDALSGEGLTGELTGWQLNRVKSIIIFWFGWKDFYPNTLVYDLEDPN
jgi:hypothetical protein